MVNYLDLLPCKYREGERGPKLYDCYGLVVEMYRRDWKIDIFDPGTCANPDDNMARLHEQAAAHWLPSRPLARRAVTFDVHGRAHIGYMLSENDFIHCIEHRDVCVESIHALLWKRTITGYYQWKETCDPDL